MTTDEILAAAQRLADLGKELRFYTTFTPSGRYSLVVEDVGLPVGMQRIAFKTKLEGFIAAGLKSEVARVEAEMRSVAASMSPNNPVNPESLPIAEPVEKPLNLGTPLLKRDSLGNWVRA